MNKTVIKYLKYISVILLATLLVFPIVIIVVRLLNIPIDGNLIFAAIVVPLMIFTVLTFVVIRLQKRAEELKTEYINNKELNKFLSGNSSITMLKLDKGLKITFINEYLLDILNYESEELLGKSILNTLMYGKQLKQLRFIQKRVESNRSGDIKVSLYSKDGMEKIFICNSYSLVNNEEYCFYGIDITSNKNFETKLKNSLFEFNALFNNSSAGIVILNNEGIIARVNHECLNILGYQARELIGSPFESLLTDSHVDYPITHVSGTDIPNIEFPLRHKEGRDVWCLVSQKRINLENIIDGIYISFQNISDKKNIEIKLKNSFERYRSLFENTGNATFTADYNLVILMCNNETSNLTGYTKDQLSENFSWDRFIASESKHTLFKEYYKLITGNTNDRIILEVTIVTAYGENKQILLKIVKSDKEESFTFTFTDISKQKKLESDLILVNNHLKLAQKTAKIGDWSYEIESDKIFVSSEVQIIHNIRSGEPVTYQKKEYTNNYKQKLLSKIKQKKSDSGVIKMRVKNFTGEKVFIDEYYSLKYNSKGELIRIMGLSQDVTEQEIAHMEIKDSKQKIDLIVSATKISHWDWNPLTRKVLFNESFNKEMGVSGDSEEWYSKLHPDELGYIKMNLKNLLTNKTDSLDLNFRMKNKNNQWVWFKAIGRVVEKSAEGRSSRVVGILMDITDKKASEDNQTALNSISARLLKMNSENREEIIRESLTELIDVVKSDLLAVIVRDTNNNVSCIIENRCNNQNSLHETLLDMSRSSSFDKLDSEVDKYEGVYYVEDMIFYGEVIGKLLIYSEDKDFIVTSFIKDTSRIYTDLLMGAVDNIRIKKELSDEEEKYRAFVEQPNNIILLFNPRGIIEYSSPGCKKIFNIKDNVTYIYDIVKSDSVELREIVKLIFINNQLYRNIEFANINMDSEHMFFRVNMSLLNEKQSMAVFQDITAKKMAQNKLKNNYNEIVNTYEKSLMSEWSLNLNNGLISVGGILISEIPDRENLTLSTIEHFADKRSFSKNKMNALVNIRNRKNGFFDQKFTFNDVDKYYRVYYKSRNVNKLLNSGIVYGIIQDVTESQLKKEDLNKSQKFYESLFHYSGNSMIVCDFKMLILECNRYFSNLTGYNVDEINGKINISKFTDKTSVVFIKHIIERILLKSDKQNSEFELEIINRNREKIQTKVTASLLSDNKIVMSFVNKSNLKMNSELLNENTLLIDTISKYSNEAIIISDISNNSIIDFNSYTTKLFGLKHERLSESKINNILGDELVKSIKEVKSESFPLIKKSKIQIGNSKIVDVNMKISTSYYTGKKVLVTQLTMLN